MKFKLTTIKMKNKLLMGIGALALVLTSCSEDWGPSGSEGGGYITPLVELDSSTLKSRADETQEEEDYKVPEVKIEDLKFKLSKDDGSFTQEFTYDKFPVDKAFSVGDYTLSAYYGDPTEEGFDMPALYGEQKLKVRDKQKTTVNLSVTLANALVKMNYSEDFKNYMTSWSAKVNEVSVISSEKKPVFVNPGKVDLKLKATKPNGKEVDLSLPSLTTVARYLHNVNVTINSETGGAGKAELVITYNEDMESVTHTLDISDDVLSAPAPVIDPDGYEDEVPVKVVEGLPYNDTMAMSIIAIAGLEEVTLETTSTYLVSKGWPSSIELMSATEAQQNKLKELGLNVLGLWKNPEDMAYIDFSDVVKNIKYETLYASNQTTFTVTVKDKLMRESDPSTIILNVEPIILQLSSAGDNFNPGEPMNVNLAFNGSMEDLENLQFEYKDKSGNWRTKDLNITKKIEGEEKDGLTNFTITLDTPDYNDDLLLRAKLSDTYSNQFTFPMAPFEVNVIENNVFAKYAYVKIVPTNGSTTPNTDNAEFYVKTEETNFVKVKSEKEADGYFKISDLTPNKNYQVRVKIGKDTSKASSFITEDDAQVPNGDFEVLELKYPETIDQGGKWTTVLRTIFTPDPTEHQSKSSYEISEPVYWTTNNEVSMNGTPNTWFRQPSVFNTSLIFKSIVPGNVFISGKTETPASYNITPISGDNSMVLRNVGWDDNGIVPSTYMSTKDKFDEYYNITVPSVTKINKGKLSISINETMSQHISRPMKLKGNYRFSSPNSDEVGKIEIKILNGSNVIVSEVKELSPLETSFEIDLSNNYNNKTLKAKNIIIEICSTAFNSDSDILLETKNSPFEAYKIGATLVVDDLEFEY